MKIVHTGDPGILSLRSDVIGCLVFVGLLFIAGGGLTIALVLEMLPTSKNYRFDSKRGSTFLNTLHNIHFKSQNLPG